MTYTPPPMNHNQHVDPDHRYACFNRKPVDKITYVMQDGWTSKGGRHMVKHDTRWLQLDGCGHSYAATDPGCQGCRWR